MMFKHESRSAALFSALVCVLILFSSSGCESARAEKDGSMANATPEGVSSNSVVEAHAEDGAASEVPTKPVKGPEQTAVTDDADVAAGGGPGDGPPPREETKSKVEEIEGSLAPLKAVPANPLS